VFSEVPKHTLLKVSAVEANIEQPGLGLSSEDHKFLLNSQVSLVFHVAANVKFNEPLHVVMKTNTLAVLGMLKLCNELPQIKVRKPECLPVYFSYFLLMDFFHTSLV
jgi:fatty acyl-CoA reductase